MRDGLGLVIPTWSVDETKAGIKTYLTGLVQGLAEVPGVRSTLLCTRRNVEVFAPLEGPQTRVVMSRMPGGRTRSVLEQLVPKGSWARLGDVVLTPSNVALLNARLPQVVVVQAAFSLPTVWRQYGQLLPQQSHVARLAHRRLLGLGLRRADGVIAVSPWIREQLLASYPHLDPGKVAVIPEGVEPALGRRPPPQPGRDPVVLFVSTLFPYKGAHQLLHALQCLQRDRPSLRWTARLVGNDPTGGAETGRLMATARELGIDRRLQLVGPVPHRQIRREYFAATLFVYPSLVEAFGLPPLEAMAARVPVIASDVPSIASTVGDAALLVDPSNPHALATAIGDLLQSPNHRADLVRRGTERVRHMTWRAAAERTAAIAASVAR